MTETYLLKQLLGDEILEQILNDMGNAPEVCQENCASTVERLRALFALVTGHHFISSRAARSTLDKFLKPLLRDVKSLQARLKESEQDTFIEPLRHAALHLLDRDTQAWAVSNDGRKPRYIDPATLVRELEQPLDAMANLVEHLLTLIDEFDKLANTDILRWPSEAEGERGRHARFQLLPHLRKGGGVGADTEFIRELAPIYEHLFGRTFTVLDTSRREDLRRKRDESDNEIARYDGPSVRFACAVINRFGLQNLFVPLTPEDLSQESDRDLSKEEASALKRDAAGMNRQQGLQGRDVSDLRLINRVGDIWDAEKDRKRSS